MTNDTDATGSTPPKTTSDGTTSTETHLARLDALDFWLGSPLPAGLHPTTKQAWAASLRWLIKRERAEPPWKAATEKAFAGLATLEENWDTYGGKPIESEYIGAARFVLDQIMAHDTPPPQVTPMSNGSVQLEWCRNGVDLEIEMCAVATGDGEQIRFCRVLNSDQESEYSLEDVDALRGTLAQMRASEELSG